MLGLKAMRATHPAGCRCRRDPAQALCKLFFASLLTPSLSTRCQQPSAAPTCRHLLAMSVAQWAVLRAALGDGSSRRLVELGVSPAEAAKLLAETARDCPDALGVMPDLLGLLGTLLGQVEQVRVLGMLSMLSLLHLVGSIGVAVYRAPPLLAPYRAKHTAACCKPFY